MNIFNNDWDIVLKDEITAPYFISMGQFLSEERAKGKTIYPDKANYFKALKLTSYDNTKVVLMGQDPYINGEADGLAFSVSDDNFRLPPSLKMILDAIEETAYQGFRVEQDWNLERLAEQGVLLLNKYFSVEKSKPSSHCHIGWETFTNSIISHLSAKDKHVCFILLGKEAQKVIPFIDKNKHSILIAEHPAAASYNKRKWNHNDVFVDCNLMLKQNGQEKIIW